ncbi:MAG: cobalamin B12-binding domain-containing protein [Candidatus Schekmanbacteria bacterium]|nr:cobalamin B12-binding domain-containing protein [Candidatus Schekmanbacteria bacterium]
MTAPTPATAAPAAQAEVIAVPLRFITATSLFDGHDASINIIRRLLQARGVEVVHLGHDRSVVDIVTAAIEEDADAIAVSSYQGGHMEFFAFMLTLLAERGAKHVRVFAGGGGTITDSESRELVRLGIASIYSAEDGRRLGLDGMIQDMITICGTHRRAPHTVIPAAFFRREHGVVSRILTALEHFHVSAATAADGDRASAARAHRDTILHELRNGAPKCLAPVVGITGVGGSGKSSLADELLRRVLHYHPTRTVAVLCIDPTRRRSGGALLGDRIRMNAIGGSRSYLRSMATRQANSVISETVADATFALQCAGFDLVLIETAGSGQSSSEIVDLSDVSVYVMTPEFGAPSQLEKIDMLDFADLVVVNKADKRGATDARNHVAKQMRRNRGRADFDLQAMPVVSCMASRYGDPGVDTVFRHLMQLVDQRRANGWLPSAQPPRIAEIPVVVPDRRSRYLADVADAVRAYRATTQADADIAGRADGLRRTIAELGGTSGAPGTSLLGGPRLVSPGDALEPMITELARRHDELLAKLSPPSRNFLQALPELRRDYSAPQNRYRVREREISVENYSESLSGTRIPRVTLPTTDDWKELIAWARLENAPGQFPFTAGIFPYKRSTEDPTRMFAGEGTPERTNKRFHYLSAGQPAARLSTAFDSVTLYGRDPERRPDIFGKIGNSGVSIATVDDAKRLYSGFDLCAPSTSVSMTINGPAPVLLAMFLNTAIDQAVERRLRASDRWERTLELIAELCPKQTVYRAPDLPETHDGSGLGLLSLSGDRVISPEEYRAIKADTLACVRGTVQADILKEDQAQNTCIFATEFALKMMGDIQEYFVENNIRNFYSVSISGYHIAEAGANPITQLAFTLSNAFTYVEYYLSRGMQIDDFARNLSFFFSNGIDPEYAVIGRVARRIWAIAMRDVYGAAARSQQLKYHIQTSGRSLHAQEISFNDIRTTLQALYAICDNCNSLHTNAYDEAITTPTEDSVRRALAIQLIINREYGLTRSENPMQGSYFLQALTDAVEHAVLQEFDRIAERGGVLGAMEVMYQRSKIQEESLLYERRKHSGELPIVGVNTFLTRTQPEGVVEVALSRSTDDEKMQQVTGVETFKAQHAEFAPAALAALKTVALAGGNIFAELMETVKVCSLEQITQALFEVGGQYRRNM